MEDVKMKCQEAAISPLALSAALPHRRDLQSKRGTNWHAEARCALTSSPAETSGP